MAANSFIFRKDTQETHDSVDELPPAPPWRRFTDAAQEERGRKFVISDEEEEMVNAALYLRRPLLVTGKPGTGKSSLAYAVAHQLGLGPVLVWPITTRSTLQQGIYSYDAMARLQDASLVSRTPVEHAAFAQDTKAPVPDIGKYIKMGPLGTAMLPGVPSRKNSADPPRPRVLLIDEIDKSDIDLPNDLLNIFEEGSFEITELRRLGENVSVEVGVPGSGKPVTVKGGVVRCESFPFVVMTSNGEREFPPAFLRRCLRLEVKPHSDTVLAGIVRDRLSPAAEVQDDVARLLAEFIDRRDTKKRDISLDQLMNAVYMRIYGLDPLMRERLLNAILRPLSDAQ
jgi:MoxR-like ATPase